MAHSPAFSLVRRLLALAAWSQARGIPAERAEAAFHAAALNRRTLLRSGMAAAAATAFPACVHRMPPPEVKVAVVGAGMAGLHCALRLSEAGFQVMVFEAQGRVGGRMWTARDQFDNGLICELGGELIDSNHTAMWALAEELGIAVDDRWAFEPQGMVRDTYWLGGRRVSADTLLAQALTVAETMKSQYTEAEEDDAAFAALDGTSLRQWLDTWVPASTHTELHTALEVAYVGEHGLEADDMSALNLHYLFGWDSEDEFLMLGESDERFHAHGGSDAFTTALADRLGRERIVTGAALTAASGGARGPYTLTFRRTADGGAFEDTCHHLVLALPFTRLREVDLSGLSLSDGKRRVIAELGYGTNVKVMGGFSRRPWWDDHHESGILTTDLPARQGWDTTPGQEGPGGVWTQYLGGTRGVDSGEGTAAQWFASILPDLETVWPGSAEAWTGKAVRMHWPSFEWNRGSYASYHVGQWAFWGTEGRREGRVHFCGEHCSLDFQGWMEGAAETGALVAAEIADDHGAARSEGHTRTLGHKLAVPQASFHGDLQPKLSWPRRRRLVRPWLTRRAR